MAVRTTPGRQTGHPFALVTHDMRTPLAVIAGSAGDLRDRWDVLAEDERLELLDAILRNGDKLTRLVEEDLQLAAADSGEIRYECTTVDLATEIRQIVYDFTRTGRTRIEVQIEAPLPPVRADQQRNAQVLANLLSNALRFSPPDAGVEVTAVRCGAVVKVAVRDHGRGISRSDARKLFRKFSRVGSGHTRGTGLGLYLCKRMVEAQGGRIWVASRAGEGATFAYTLPIARGANGAA